MLRTNPFFGLDLASPNQMSWKKKVREIALRNPVALPEWMRSAQDKAWDRVAWHQNDARDSLALCPERPIIAVMRWLAKRGLLTTRGIASLRRFEAVPRDAELTLTHVTPKAALFLDWCYEKWYQEHAVNAALDPKVALVESSLDEAWAAYGRAISPMNKHS
jgi:hypothetical protein